MAYSPNDEFESDVSGDGGADLRADGFALDSDSWLRQLRSAESVLTLGAIGEYRLDAEVGRGAQGIVHRAWQPRTNRQIAIKRLAAGSFATAAMRARFEREVEAASVLDHPYIITVYAMDLVDGQPVLAMEWVDGQPVDAWSDRLGGDRGAIERRLRLFLGICGAVQHAHQRGVIHRDLKPSNILVNHRDEPRILDFGLAKLSAPEGPSAVELTRTTEFVGTPAYAAPERLASDGPVTDVRSDVYSLGVVLYRMLTGELPFSANLSFEQLLQAIREHEPRRPSAVNPALGREMDAIVNKALTKDPSRRYASVDAFAADVQRYLAGDAVLAHPPSGWYQLRKFVRRHRTPVAAGAVVAAVLVVATVVSMYFAISESRQRRLALAARQEAEKQAQIASDRAGEARQAQVEAEKAAAFQQSQLADIDASVMGANIRGHIVEGRRVALKAGGRDDEDIAAAVRALEESLAGVNFTNVALETLDENIFERALAAIEKDFADQPLLKARLLQTVAVVLRELGALDKATAPQTEALDIRRRTLGDDHPDALAAINEMGFLLDSQGKYAEAEPYFREALEGRRRVLGGDHPDTLTSVNNFGFLLQEQGEYAGAEPYWREALEGRRRVLGDDHPDTLESINNLGFLLVARGKYAEAEPYWREALAGFRRVLGDNHPDTLTSINNLGYLLRAQGKYARAEPYYREALEGSRRVLGDDHPDTLRSINNMGFLLKAQSKYAEAERYFREALAGFRRVLGDDHPNTLNSINNMGLLLKAQGRYSEAESYYREALEGFRRVLGHDHPDTLTPINNMGGMLRAQGRFAEAEPYYREALAGRRRVLGDDHPDTLLSINNMGSLLGDLQRFEEAETLLLEAAAGIETLPPAHELRSKVLNNLVQTYTAWHAAEPDKGYDKKSAEWRAKLKQRQAASQPSIDPKTLTSGGQAK